MRVIGLFGSQPRHMFFLQGMLEMGLEVRAVLMKRESLMPTFPGGEERDRRNFVRHFEQRHAVEEKEFGEFKAHRLLSDVDHIQVSSRNLSSPEVADFVAKSGAETGIVFGTDLIADPVRTALPRDTVNVHLGLSPRYRGSATLFWPFYFLEPQFCGITFHRLLSEPDAGEILHQLQSELRPGDGIHDVGARTVKQGLLHLSQLFSVRDRGWTYIAQSATGRNFLTTDFRPPHLRVIYDLYEDSIVDAYLEGYLGGHPPKLYQCTKLGVAGTYKS